MTTSTKPTSTGRLVMWNMVTLDGYFEGSKQKKITTEQDLYEAETPTKRKNSFLKEQN